MKPEQRMWQRVAAIAHSFSLCQRHEDRLSPDVPDVSFVRRTDGVGGWVEGRVGIGKYCRYGRAPLSIGRGVASGRVDALRFA